MTDTLTNYVARKRDQWEIEAGTYFCNIMRRGGRWYEVQYPTGLILVRAELGNEKAEIKLETAKKIKKSNWTFYF